MALPILLTCFISINYNRIITAYLNYNKPLIIV